MKVRGSDHWHLVIGLALLAGAIAPWLVALGLPIDHPLLTRFLDRGGVCGFLSGVLSAAAVPRLVAWQFAMLGFRVLVQVVPDDVRGDE